MNGVKAIMVLLTLTFLKQRALFEVADTMAIFGIWDHIILGVLAMALRPYGTSRSLLASGRLGDCQVRAEVRALGTLRGLWLFL